MIFPLYLWKDAPFKTTQLINPVLTAGNAGVNVTNTVADATFKTPSLHCCNEDPRRLRLCQLHGATATNAVPFQTSNLELITF